MVEYTCYNCGFSSKDDTVKAELLLQLYGKVRCRDCGLKNFTKMFGEDPLPYIIREKVKA